MTTPRGIRNNNPGNIRHGDPWQGLAKKQTDKAFCQFANAAYGIRALARTLITYQDKYDLRTIEGIINRWAPPIENNTLAYVAGVTAQTGFAMAEKLDMHNYKHIKPVLEAIIRHENGNGHESTPNTWYDNKTIDKGLMLAGIEPPKKAVSKVPVTRETLGATATGGVGITQIAEVAPQVMNAITHQQDSLTSGEISRVVVGVVLVALAVFIALSQVSKFKKGLD